MGVPTATEPSLDAERLLIEAAQADPARFDALYERYVGRVYAFALARTRDRQRAEDVTSETFHRALRGLPRFRWRGIPLSSWLLTIASNVIAKDARPAPAVESEADRAQDFAPEIVERARIWACVRDLEPDHRTVLALRFADDLSIAEVAQRMGRSEGAIKQLQRRALAAARERMGERDD